MSTATLPAPPALALRDYQTEALSAIERAEEQGCRRQLVVLPTAAGKTVIFSHLLASRCAGGGRGLVLAHRDELVGQACAKIRAVWPDADVGVLQGDRDELGSHVLVASVQTLARAERLARLAAAVAGELSLVVTDEAHHAAAPAWRRIYAALRAGETDGPLHVGFTATPERSDGAPLGDLFERVVYHRGVREMVEAGWLVVPRGRIIACPVDLTAMRVRDGDWIEADLDAALAGSAVMDAIARAWLQHARERTTLAFTPGVASAYALAETVNRLGGVHLAEALHGGAPAAERSRLTAALRTGDLRMLANCQVLTEGFDCPRISCVLMARPTHLRPFWQQMAGRGLRPSPATGKRDCLIFDVTGRSAEQSLVTLPVVFGLPDRDLAGRSPWEAERAGAARRRDMHLSRHDAEVELLPEILRRFAWREVALQAEQPLYVLSLAADRDGSGQPSQHHELRVRQQRGTWIAEYRRRPRGEGWESSELYRGDGQPGQEYAFGVAEAWLSERRDLLRFAQRDAPWRLSGQAATEAQVATLRRLGLAEVEARGLSKEQASARITQLAAERDATPATARQIWKLRRLGVFVPKGLTKGEAGRMIDQAVRRA